MTLKLTAGRDIDPPPARIDMAPEIRQLASGLNTATGRMAGMLGRAWSTEPSVEEAKKLLIEIARDALILHGKL